MTTDEQARWLNEYDNRHDSHWGVIQVGGEEFLGQLGSDRATVIAPREIVFIILGQIQHRVAIREADSLEEEVFEVLKGLLASECIGQGADTNGRGTT